MISTKVFEVRDRMTCASAMAIRLRGIDARTDAILRHAGFEDREQVLFILLDPIVAHYSPFDWHDRTFMTAHRYVQERWDDLLSGDVLDIEWILGETRSIRSTQLR